MSYESFLMSVFVVVVMGLIYPGSKAKKGYPNCELDVQSLKKFNVVKLSTKER